MIQYGRKERRDLPKKQTKTPKKNTTTAPQTNSLLLKLSRCDLADPDATEIQVGLSILYVMADMTPRSVIRFSCQYSLPARIRSGGVLCSVAQAYLCGCMHSGVVIWYSGEGE